MIHTNLLIPVALAIAPLLTGASAANFNLGDTDIRSAIIERFDEKLSESEGTDNALQGQFDEIIAAVESREFSAIMSSRPNFGGLTDEQKAEFAEKGAELFKNGGIGKRFGGFGNGAELTDEQKAEISAKMIEALTEKLESGEITQEKYDEIIAAVKSGEFSAIMSNRPNFGGLTDEQKAEFAEKGAEFFKNGGIGKRFGGFGNDEAPADAQDPDAAENRSVTTESNRFGSVKIGLRGGFTAYRA